MAELIVGENSYISLDEANSLVENNYTSFSDEYKFWSGLSDNDKAVLVLNGMNKIDDDKWLWKNKLLDVNQKLQFPRIDNSGNIIECPERIKFALIHIAVDSGLYESSEEYKLKMKGVSSYKIKDASVSFDNSSNASVSNKISGIDRNIFYEYIQEYTLLV